MTLGIQPSLSKNFFTISLDYLSHKDETVPKLTTYALQTPAEQEVIPSQSDLGKNELLMQAIKELAIRQNGFPYLTQQDMTQYVTKYFNKAGIKVTNCFIKQNQKQAFKEAGVANIVIQTSRVDCYLPLLLKAVKDYKKETKLPFIESSLNQRMADVFSKLKREYPNQIHNANQKRAFSEARKIALKSVFRHSRQKKLSKQDSQQNEDRLTQQDAVKRLKLQDSQYAACVTSQVEQERRPFERADWELLKSQYMVSNSSQIWQETKPIEQPECEFLQWQSEDLPALSL